MKTLAGALGLALACVAFVALVPAVAAQGDLAAPLAERADEKVSAARNDPQGFAADQTSEEQLSEDLRWSAAYACFAADEATGTAGIDVPDIEQCAGYEEALGIAEEEQEEIEEDVADAVPLEDDAVASAEAVADDALDTVADVVREPDTALDQILGFFGRTLDTVTDLLGGILDGLDGALDTLQGALGILGKGAAHAMAAPFVGTWWLLTAAWTGATGALTAAASGLLDAKDAAVGIVQNIARGATSGAKAGGDAVADAVTDAADAVRALVERVLGTSGSAPEVAPDPADAATEGLDDATSLVDTVTEILPVA